MFNRIIFAAVAVFFMFSLTACGTSKQVIDMQAQLDNLQRQPAMPVFNYSVSAPFILNGKLISQPQEFANALGNRPKMVTAAVEKNRDFGDMLVKFDMEAVGYSLLGKKTKGRMVEMTFKDDSQAAFQAAQAVRNQEVQQLNARLQQLKQQEEQKNQMYTAIGVGIVVPVVIGAGTLLFNGR